MESLPSHTSRCVVCSLNGCKSVTTCACGQEESVYPCYWMAGVTVGELQGLAVHRDTIVRVVGFYHFQLNKDVNKGREREWKGCGESVHLISILSVAEIGFIRNISDGLPYTVVLPPHKRLHFQCIWHPFKIYVLSGKHVVLALLCRVLPNEL